MSRQKSALVKLAGPSARQRPPQLPAGVWLAPAVLFLLSGCGIFAKPPVTGIPDDWTKATLLESDLREAARAFEAAHAHDGTIVQVKWVNTEEEDYTIGRDKFGNIGGEWVHAMAVFEYPALNRCFLSDRFSLYRRYTGGGRYGVPRFTSYTTRPLEPLDENGRKHDNSSELPCSAADTAKGGVHFATRSVASAEPAPTTAPATNTDNTPNATRASASGQTDDEPMAQLAAGVSSACRNYAMTACSRPDLGVTDRKGFCERIVARVNARSRQPNAEQYCQAKLKSTARR
jgi:hypothetical protein